MSWRRFILMVGWLAGLFLLAGCKNLFPHSESTNVSHWKTYADVEAAFGKIVPYHTTVDDLQLLHFDPKSSPNVKMLNYVDIIQTFMPTPAIRMQDLPAGVQECIQAREKSRAYLVSLRNIQAKRHGNLFLDIFGFKRYTHESGWEFKGLILIKEDLVVFKIYSGEPQVSRDDNRVKPLGPLQEIDFSASDAAGYAR